MTQENFIALALFAIVSTGTPGPNNLMVMASGANFGVRRTWPHILGIAIGFSAMIFLVGAGLSRVFEVVPWLDTALLIASAVFLAYLAWKIATAAPPDPDAPRGSPFTFVQAAAFQWVNPKAWAMALTTATVYAPGAAATAGMVFAAVAVPLIVLWAIAGRGVARFLTAPRALRAFNWTMAALLIASTLPALM
ncbi:Cysteine/O-acetylserine efflux protein [Rhodobacteraceae bacterium THAF1]|uniref:LysE family translocator n=1 Tax=Palleronia sp. THAF1 TaxID=2587842 RepID=UPI000F3D5B53|nr:LysE family translocator [Palleronia sp. THAF1]QFU09365.1 Cysteine/O-acetylserine efflux protein [Palleronia sp. THAF1]VDC22055.1 Cysteine/O-acetylserine efflux protein [Rhodobacteraceae bacterium THAF1]